MTDRRLRADRLRTGWAPQDAERGDVVTLLPNGPLRSSAVKNPESLDHLLDRVAHGDEAAFAAVYQEVAEAVYGLAHTMTDDAAQSEEVATETLAEVWRTASRYRLSAAGSARSWVMRIARQRAVNHVRTVRAAQERQAPAGLDQRGTGLRGADTLGESGLVSGPEQQTALLALYGGYSQDEIADLLGLTPRAVAGFIRDGLRRLASRDASLPRS